MQNIHDGGSAVVAFEGLMGGSMLPSRGDGVGLGELCSWWGEIFVNFDLSRKFRT